MQAVITVFPFSAGALIFGCTVALCFLIRDLMFYVIGEFFFFFVVFFKNTFFKKH